MAEESGKDGLLRDFLKVNIKTLKLVGLWNSFGLERKTHGAYTAFSSFVSAVIFIHVLTQVADLFYTWGDLENFSATASTFLTYGAALIKQLCYLKNSKRIYRLVYRLRDGKLSPPSIWSEEQKNIAKAYDRHARIMSWSYYSLGIGCLFGFAMTAIVSSTSTETQHEANTRAASSRKLPYRAVFPFDTEQLEYYGIAFSFQMLVILFGPTVNIGLDTMFVGLIIHACGQFKILKNSLRHIKQRAINIVETEKTREEDALRKTDGTISDNNQEEYICFWETLQQQMSKELNECLQHHQKILMFIEELENVFNPMMLAQFLSSSGTLCLIIFQITVMDDMGFGMATFVQFLAISIMQLLLYCWYGNELTYQCESVVRSAYQSPWYEASEEFKHSIRIMVVRSMKPFRLSGGKLYIMSLDTFVAMMRASFSYFTMLNQLNGS